MDIAKDYMNDAVKGLAAFLVVIGSVEGVIMHENNKDYKLKQNAAIIADKYLSDNNEQTTNVEWGKVYSHLGFHYDHLNSRKLTRHDLQKFVEDFK